MVFGINDLFSFGSKEMKSYSEYAVVNREIIAPEIGWRMILRIEMFP